MQRSREQWWRINWTTSEKRVKKIYEKPPPCSAPSVAVQQDWQEVREVDWWEVRYLCTIAEGSRCRKRRSHDNWSPRKVQDLQCSKGPSIFFNLYFGVGAVNPRRRISHLPGNLAQTQCQTTNTSYLSSVPMSVKRSVARNQFVRAMLASTPDVVGRGERKN